MRIILLGSTGLIGGGIWKRLRELHEVVRLGRHSICELYGDLSDPASIAKLDFSGFDAIVHCAGVVDSDFLKEPQKAWSQTIGGIYALAARAVSDNVGRLIYFSTTHVYGAFHGTITERRRPDPGSAYAIAHYAAEQILKSFACDKMKVFILRPNAVYGIPADWEKFDRWSLLPFDLPLQAIYRGKIILKTSGIQKRNFVSTEDLAAYVERLLTFSSKRNPLFLNAVGSDTLTIYGFARMCAEIYRNKKDAQCPIERADLPSTAEDFQISTNVPGFRASRKVRDFVNEFTSAVIEKLKKGKTYGEYGH